MEKIKNKISNNIGTKWKSMNRVFYKNYRNILLQGNHVFFVFNILRTRKFIINIFDKNLLGLYVQLKTDKPAGYH